MSKILIAIIFIQKIYASSILIAALARVNDRVITTREMQISSLVGEVFLPIEKLIGAKLNPFEEVVLLQVIYIEAKPFEKQFGLESKKMELQSQVKNKMDKDLLWKKLTVGKDELNFIIERRLLVESFLNFKFDPHLISVNQGEVHNYFKFNIEKYGGRKLEDVEEKIREAVRSQKRQELINDWIGIVKKRQDIYYFNNSAA